MGQASPLSQLGLYRREEHDACGVGFVAQLGAPPSHRVVEQALECLANLTHRGGVDADAASGDGAGLMVQLPHNFFVREAARLNFYDVSNSRLAVGALFLPQDHEARAEAMRVVERVVAHFRLRLVGWRRVPVDESALGPQARDTMPEIRHLLISGAPSHDREFEQELYLVRKEIERRLLDNAGRDEATALAARTYIASLSCRNIVYKGLLSPPQLGAFYSDLRHPDFTTSAALFHQRYSTNTMPSWELAQPFRLVAHNGEINTLLGNRNWMRAREPVLAHPVWGRQVESLKPVIRPGGSDSASFDNVLEVLTRSGRSVQHALLMMIPEAWESSVETPADVKAFHHYHSCLMEPWDGPAAMAFLDGPVVGAALDRIGLRPARYTITHDGLVVLGSEAGILPIEPGRVKEKGRLGPGQILVVDLKHQKILKSDQVKRQVSRGRHYRRWILQNMSFAPRMSASDTALARDAAPEPGGPAAASTMDELTARQRAAGYTKEDVELLIRPMAAEKKEGIGSMGDDAPLAPLSHHPRPLYHYFRQMFAQVTNPPIDPLRESLVMSLGLYLGPRHSVLVETPDHARMIRLESPFLFNEELERLRQLGSGYFKPVKVSTLFDFNPGMSDDAGVESMTRALDRVVRECCAAVEASSSILILSDSGLDREHAAVPMLLATAAVVEGLMRANAGNKADLVLETAEAWEPHQFACLIGYGAGAINPYLALETVAGEARQSELGEISAAQALENYRATVESGLKKIMSKMGISTLASYLGGKFFEIIGLDPSVVNRFFPETRSLVGGRNYTDIARDVLERHRGAFQASDGKLEFSGFYRFRKGLERHAYSADVIRHLQKAARENNPAAYRALADELENREPLSIRDLLRFKPQRPVPLNEVQPAAGILRRFSTQAMSLGSLSPETQRTLAVAMNRIGGKSNTGEGGEDPDVYLELVNGESAAHKIKQVASGRFGVTPEYLVRAEELEIKMAQGSKPGEGGQLPAHKVTPLIARVRRAVTGIALISPPPHHDIYSIEDLAQLIYDLREINPRARIGVKLVSQAGVGTVACGVAKANANVVLISGHDGGTGASPLGSIKSTGSPWEMGLAEAHQALVANGMRGRVRLRVDGGLKTGRDVVIAAMLGAQEFGFGTAALVALACVMARQCHLNTCPVGVATQREDLRLRFPNEPERLVHYFEHVAQHVRETLASLGFRSLEEAVGRTDLLEVSTWSPGPGEGSIDLAPLVARLSPSAAEGQSGGEPAAALTPAAPRPGQVDPLAIELAADVRKALACHETVRKQYAITNTNRTIGARAAGEIALIHGNEGLREGSAEFRFTGSAGQSFGAFLVPGLRLVLEGEANDYVGKGMGGGEIVIRPPGGSNFEWSGSTILGNAVLYGATGGRLFAAGRAGERFAVRNSGAVAVVEGVGDHGCEYMTGGVVVVLGETGRNFGAGMTNGLAYVYDRANRFERRYNPELLALQRVSEPEDSYFLRQLVFFHLEETGSSTAREILDAWSGQLPYFWKVHPRSREQKAPKIRRAALSRGAAVA
ncbi:MAG TPA: glutamate synthase large subunit [Terriglobia bacterium]|nr:glutamate synthase large subunit [Terriglobia bacterium]